MAVFIAVNRRFFVAICLFLQACVLAGPVEAALVLFHGGVGGSVNRVSVRADDSLIELARAYDIGYNEIAAANPGVDPFIPDVGTPVTIPARWLLPEVKRREGIVINLSEMRLYYFNPRYPELVETFPIGIGDEGWETPTGTYRIIEKISNPAWHVPPSIRAHEHDLPEVVPPGPNNPLGTHALRLSIGTVLIHGTNRPFGIGRKVSHGCIHLYPEDIRVLFRKVKPGTRVVIVDQPVKVDVEEGRVLVEVHGERGSTLATEAFRLLKKKGLSDRVDPVKVREAVAARSGIPTDVTRQ